MNNIEMNKSNKMIIQVIKPLFYVNRDNPNIVHYDQIGADGLVEIVIKHYDSKENCPIPNKNEILYRYTDNRCCLRELTENGKLK